MTISNSPEIGDPLETIFINKTTDGIRSTTTSRPTRSRRIPAKLKDFIPYSAEGRWLVPPETRLTSSEASELYTNSEPPALVSKVHLVFQGWCTELNKYGLHREYISKPTGPLATTGMIYVPVTPQQSTNELVLSLSDALGPFPNYSTFRLATWYWRIEGVPSDAESRKLTQGVFTDALYCHEDVKGVDLSKYKTQVVSYTPDPFSQALGWRDATIKIPVPDLNTEVTAEFSVHGFRHRSIVDVYTNIIVESKDLVWTPYREYHTREDGTRERMYGEIYDSDHFISEYHKVQSLPLEPDCSLNRAIVGLMLWSDATLLANFGDAKLWPVYMAVANQSKYVRSHPKSNALRDIAYFPSVCPS
jgi:hypothetical protein